MRIRVVPSQCDLLRFWILSGAKADRAAGGLDKGCE